MMKRKFTKRNKIASPIISLAVFIAFGLISNSIYSQVTNTYTSSGTWVCPAGVTSVTVECWGAGGGGGSRSGSAGNSGGGGGGAYARSIVTVVPGNSYNFTVGSGGGGNTAGGNSTFNTSTVIAAGGSGGTNNSPTAGAGGTAANSTGDIEYIGGNGATGGTYSGGGGGGAGTTGAGGNAPTAASGSFGTGTSLGGGNGGASVSGASNGSNGVNFGGGGSGSSTSGIGSKSGGSGAGGQVKITYCTSPTSYAVALNEGFEGATFPPTGWTQYDCPGDGSSNDWSRGGFAAPNTAPEGSYSAIIEYDASNIVNRALQTPAIDITNYTCANLSYYVFIDGTWDEEMHVEITKDGGTNWISLASHGTTYSGWSPLQTISLDSYVGYSVSIRFRYYQPSDDNSSGIDGVLITGCSSPPISITTNPTNQSICYNSSADFSVSATGTGTLSYQWKYQGNNVVNGTPANAVYSGATSSTLTVSGTIANATYSAYTCVVSDVNGSVTSTGANLIVSSNVAPAAPTNLTRSGDIACPGTPVSLGGTVSSGVLEWHIGTCSGTSITSPVSPLVTTTYYAKAFDSGTGCRSACSEITVTVLDAIVFVEQPLSQTGCVGTPVSFTVTATGAGLTYQWKKNGVDIPGATSSLYSILSLVAGDAGNYTCTITSSCSTSATSSTAVLTILGSGLSGIKTVGTAGNYLTLKAAFDAINTNGLSGNLELQIISNITEAAEASLNQWVDCAGNSGYVVTIYPTGATRTISGNIATSLVTLNGVDKITIDGRIDMTGAANSLVFSNTNTAGSTLKLVNDACDNTIKYATFKGVYSTDTKNGVIFFGTATTSGNDNNNILFCNIQDGLSTPTNGIYSSGTFGKENDFNTISNCNIFNFWKIGSLSCGISIGDGNNAWTISNNSFYQQAPRSDWSFIGIYIYSLNGNGYSIIGNKIGGSAPSCGGGAWTISGTTYNSSVEGIRLVCSSNGISTISNNVIKNFNINMKIQDDQDGAFTGIISWGRVDVIGNIIGDNGTGSIKLNCIIGATTTWTGWNSGIIKYGDGNVLNNRIGSITINGTVTSQLGFNAIQVAGTLINDVIISGNVIGNETTANSISTAAGATPAATIGGIYFGTDGNYNTTVSNNTVANISNNCTGTGAFFVGLYNDATNGKQTVTGNVIRNISASSTRITDWSATNLMSAMTGIASINSINGGHSITNNTINSFSSTGTGAVQVFGIICHHDITTGTTIEKNNIFDLNASSNTSIIAGIKVYKGIANVFNNMISLGTNTSTSALIRGIWQYTTSNCNYYFNSVYIGGTATVGAINTYGFVRDQASTVNFKNNILYNARTGGGKNFAIVTNSNVITSNYNDLFTATAANLGSYNSGTTSQTFATWKTGTIQDANSINGDPLFVNNATDLHLQNGSPAIGLGIAGTGVLIDIDNQVRKTGVNPNGPCMGADENLTAPFGTNAYGIHASDGINGNITDCEITAVGGTPGGIGVLVGNPADVHWANVNISGYQVITASNISCLNSDITFNTTSGSPAWLLGNGSNPSTSSTSPSLIQYTSTGRKDIIENVKVFRGFANLTMVAPDPGTILGAPSGAGCPTTYNYTSSAAGSAGFNYSWACTPPSGCTVTIASATQSSTNITFVNQTGVNQIFLVTLDIETECCGPLRQVKRYITIFPGPTMPIISGNPYSICTGGTQAISVTTPNPTYSFEWFTTFTGGTQLGSGTSYTFTPIPSGPNSYYVQSTNVYGCSSQRTLIEIEGVDATPPSVDGASTCGTNDVTLTINSPVAGYTYNWYITSCGGTPLQTSTSTSFTYNVLATTTFYVAAIPPGCAMSTCVAPLVTVLTPTNPITWLGGAAGGVKDWFVAANWQNGCIPTCATNVLIPNVTHDPEVKFDPSQVAAAKNLNLQSGAVLSFMDNKAVLQICGDFTHAGVLTTNDFGTIEFTGSAAQSYIYSSGTGEFNNVKINNIAASPSLTITGGDMIISSKGSLSFLNGILITGTNKLKINNTSTSSISGYAADRYVDGKLQRATDGASIYRFPIGHTTYGAQGFDIKPTGASGSTVLGYLETYTFNPLYLVAYCDVETNPGGSHVIGSGTAGYDGILDKIDFNLKSPLQWDISNPSGGITSYDLTVYPSGTQLISTVQSANGVKMLFLMKNGEPGNSGATPTGTALPSFSATGFLACPNQTSLSGLTTFSKFNLNGSSGPGSILPVELLKFGAYYNGESVDLDWTTASEINNDYFQVQKSIDAIDFSSIGIVFSKAPNGNSNSKLFYTYNDKDVTSGTYYYRLKQFDFDGAYEYSNIASIIIGEDGIFSIQPNPAKESVEINYYCIKDSDLVIKIFDSRGRLAHIEKLYCIKGQNKSTINISNLLPGMYMVSLITDNGTEQAKLIKQ